ncbi:MAG: hypothetical protein KDD60_05195 [Bdellovibrionales bacterium]|nr:hypothetical protein [Bdellovibrionales bacterium]
MTTSEQQKDVKTILPLSVFTPRAWAISVLDSPLVLLNDHAHLERKASTNALQLLHQWPYGEPPLRWSQELADISRDESHHLSLVVKILQERGGVLSQHHRNRYAQDLRECVRTGKTPDELLDRLLISALIEARSCERFKLLAECSTDAQLRKLYHGLWSSEHDHYLVFYSLAELLVDGDTLKKRWNELLELESEIIQKQSKNVSIHSWVENSDDREVAARSR